MKKNLLLFSFILFVSSLLAQTNPLGLPFVKNYTIEDYQASTQNLAILESKSDLMYFGNVGGVLTYDGVSWNLIQTNNTSAVQALAEDIDGCIYVGAVGEFGYLSANKKYQCITL